MLLLSYSGERTKRVSQQLPPLRVMSSHSLQQGQVLSGSLTLLGISVITAEGE